MRRMQLVEFEDLPWFPAAVRDAATDYLRLMVVVGNIYAPAVPLLAHVLRASHTRKVVDLCSGGGGPWQKLLPVLAADGVPCDVLLTDRYPNLAALDAFPAEARQSGRIAYEPRSIDALAVPSELDGVRTLFTALHHFPPEAAATLIGDVVCKHVPIAVFEATQRTAGGILITLLAPLLVLLATPFIRPVRLRRLLLTYVVPIVPLVVLWDGIISCLRSYTVAELEVLVASIPGTVGYDWQIGVTRGSKTAPITYLIGLPRPDDNVRAVAGDPAEPR